MSLFLNSNRDKKSNLEAGKILILEPTYELVKDVNIASRMESNGIVGKIQVSQSTYKQLVDKFEFIKREKIQVKGKGMM